MHFTTISETVTTQTKDSSRFICPKPLTLSPNGYIIQQYNDILLKETESCFVKKTVASYNM